MFGGIKIEGKNNIEKNIFRIAAVLYKDEKYEATRSTTIRKFVETSFMDTNNTKMTTTYISKYIQDNYNIIFSEEEIINSLDDKYFVNSEGRYSLKDTRHDQLNKVLENQSNIGTYIDEYLESINSIEKEKDKGEIIRFLYDTFTKNVYNYKNFLSNNKIDLSEINEKDYNVELINNFLEYKSPEKDKIIFNVMSLSLEYCLLTNKEKNWGLNELKNKIFYIDSNIIYRSLGLNGKNRQITTTRFMQKCHSIDIKFKVLPLTIKEFKTSVKYNVDRIRRNQVTYHTNVSPEVFSQYSNDNFKNFYYEWASGNPNDTKVDFLNYIESSMKSFFDDYSVITDYSSLEVLKKIKDETITEISNLIFNYKSRKGMNVSDQTSLTDGELIVYLNYKRGKNTGNNILSNKYFLISTDQGLKNWVTNCNIHSTLVMLPTDWMTIMLRYINRTDDDYASYSSFLTLKMSDPALQSAIKVDTVINSIAKHVDSAQEQKYYMETIFDNNMLDVLVSNREDSDIEEIDALVSNYVEKDLETRVSKLEKDIEINNIEKQSHIDDKEKANKKFKTLMKEDLESWENRGLIGGIIQVLIAFFIVSQAFASQGWVYNAITLIDNKLISLNETAKVIFQTLVLIPLIGLPGRHSYRLIQRKIKCSTIYKEKVKELEEKYKI